MISPDLMVKSYQAECSKFVDLFLHFILWQVDFVFDR